MNDTSRVEVVPSPRRLINSLRDLGYDSTSAVADLVDNSIEAKATEVFIEVHMEGRRSWIRIADNGKGMTPAVLQEAMRYGTEREYGPSDLGKFGLGLKTASQSQCREFIVASRSGERANICAFAWDMEYVERTNRWEILRLAPQDIDDVLCKPLQATEGTAILWKKLDRVFNYKNPDGGWAAKNLLGLCRKLEDHLAMVFHRFISGENDRGHLNIFLNGNKIKPWDPFTRNEAHTKELGPLTFELDDGEARGKVVLEPFVLPPRDKFSSPDAFKKASGPKNWNQQQGFYIYRSGRMIQSGGWSGLRTVDEHSKLARVALHFSPALDDAFKINVAKMHTELPSQLREQIKDATKQVIKIAQETYRAKKPSGRSATGSSSRRDSQPTNPLRKWTLDEIATLLRSSARDEEIPTINRVINRVRKTFKEKHNEL